MTHSAQVSPTPSVGPTIAGLLSVVLAAASFSAVRAEDTATFRGPATAEPTVAAIAETNPEFLEPDVAPELLRFVEAESPAEAMRAGRQVTVELELLVNATGSVDSVWVVEGLDPALDAAATQAARQFVFSPARAEGEPVAVYVQYRYEFSLREQARRLVERANLLGRVREQGTGADVVGAIVSVDCPDARDDSTLSLPWSLWRETIGRYDGQYLDGDRLVTVTDSTGRFQFKTLPPGAIDLRVVSAGYAPFALRETIGADQSLEVDYRILRESYARYEMVVYGRAESKEVARQRLSVTEVERLAGFGGDVIKSVQALPGVARPSVTDPGAVVVRGSGRFDTRYVLDGIDIPLLFHYGGVKSTYNSLALSSVDLYPSGFGPRYGGCVGGVIEVRGRPARTDEWRTTLDASFLDASFHVEGPLGRGFGLLFTGRRSYAGELVRAALSGRDDFKLTVAPYYADLVARVDRGSSPDDRLFLTAFAAKDRMELVLPKEDEGSPEVNDATDAVEMDLQFSRLILGYDRAIGRNLRNELRASYGRNDEAGHIFGFFDWKADGPYYQLRDELVWRARPALTANLGVDLALIPLSYRVTALGWPTSKRRYDFSDLGFYASTEWRPASQVSLTPGIRYDYYDHLHEGMPSLRLTGRYALPHGHTLSGAIGSYNQPPQPIGQSTDPVFGNPDLPPTEATHIAIGDEWRLNDRTSLKVETYLNRQRKIPAFTDSLQLNFLPDAEGRMYGMEVMLRRDLGSRFFGWLAYSLSRSERRYARRPSTDQEGAGMFGIGTSTAPWDPERWWPYEFDQTHHLEAVGSWVLGRNWSTGFRLQYTSGNPATPILNFTDGRFEFDADTGDYQIVSGEYLSDRMDPYVRLDLRVDRKFVRRSSIWSLYLDIQNANYFVYNSPEGYIHNYDYSKRDPYGWYFLPALGCRVEF